MKFSLATATLGLITIAQATLTPYSGYSGYSGGDDDKYRHGKSGIETLRGKFALAVKELLGYEHGKHKDRGLHIVYEIDDGQLQYGDRKDYIYYPYRNENSEEECSDEDDGHHKKRRDHTDMVASLMMTTMTKSGNVVVTTVMIMIMTVMMISDSLQLATMINTISLL